MFEKHHEQELKRAGGKAGKKGKGQNDEVEEDDEKEDEEEQGDGEEKGDDEESQTKVKAKSGSKQDEFILRVRMGTFEDSGACKG